MTREEVIRGLECCLIHGEGGCDECPYMGKGLCQELLAEDAIALLKAQEPVEPVVDKDTWKFGNCGHTLEHQQLLGDNVLFHEQYNYCPECGRDLREDGA